VARDVHRANRGVLNLPVRVSPISYDCRIENHADFPTYGLDIETDTAIDGLDPEVSPIVAVAVTGDDLEEVIDGKEASILQRLDTLLGSLPTGVIITWNGTRFDLPFIARRAEILGIDLGLVEPSGEARWFGHTHLDGYVLYRADVGDSIKLSCGLKPLARFVGLPVIEVDRTKIHELTTQQCRAYVASDAYLARELVHRRWPTTRIRADLGSLAAVS